MAVSELEKNIIIGLQLCKIPREGMIVIVSLLETEEQQEEMLDWMIQQDEAPTEQELLKKAVEIAGLR